MLKGLRHASLLILLFGVACARKEAESEMTGSASGPAAASSDVPAYQSGKMHVHDPSDPSHSPGKNYQGGSADSIEAGKQHVHDPSDPSHSPGKHLETQVLPDAASDAKEFYTCPMHAEVRKAALGNCPICGMRLVKKTAK